MWASEISESAVLWVETKSFSSSDPLNVEGDLHLEKNVFFFSALLAVFLSKRQMNVAELERKV